MFSKFENNVTSFPSSWKTEQEKAAGTTQTEELQVKDEETQVLQVNDVSIQTDQEVIPDRVSTNYDEPSLLEFLNRVTPQVIKELEKASRTRAFVGYSDLDEATNSGVKCIHTLRWQHILPEHIVTDVGWSSTGSVVGVAYGAGLHDDWCTHKGAVAIWNINRNDFAANVPEQIMEVSTCVTCIAFHPSNPAILAAGNMAGEVMVFDLSRDQETTPLVMGDSGGIGITCLAWVSGAISSFSESSSHFRNSPLSLVSATAGGTVLVWNINQAKETISLIDGYLVESQDVPREVRSQLSDSGGVGFTCITFGSDDTSIFILGTEGGAVLLCSSLLKERSGTAIGEINLLKCVTSSFSPHAGRVLHVDSSPFHRHAIHTLGSDNNLRLYSLLQPNKPLHIIYSEDSMTCSQWSPSRPMVATVGKVGGDICFFNFGNKTSDSILTLPSAEKPSPISCLSFSKKNMKLLAAGDHLGRVFIWQLPDSIVSPTSAEQTALNKIIQIAAE